MKITSWRAQRVQETGGEGKRKMAEKQKQKHKQQFASIDRSHVPDANLSFLGCMISPLVGAELLMGEAIKKKKETQKKGDGWLQEGRGREREGWMIGMKGRRRRGRCERRPEID